MVAPRLRHAAPKLTATAAAETQSLYWFAGSAFPGSSAPSVPLATLPPRGGDFT